MSENNTSKHTPQGSGGATVAVELMDVLMRGLETARRGLDDREGGEGAGLFCGFAYGSPGTICPFAYWHSESVTEK